jgi:hypothetical protein
MRPRILTTTLPEIPNTWLVGALIIGLCVMRYFGIDSFTTAGIGLLIGYVTGKHIEQTKTC